MFHLEFYATDAGKCPVAEFIDSLPQKLQAKAIRDLDILAKRGPELRQPYSKHLRDGLFELRIQSSGDAARIFYFFFIGEKIVLVDGFVKKTQRTPQGLLQKALRYKIEYEGRLSP